MKLDNRIFFAYDPVPCALCAGWEDILDEKTIQPACPYCRQVDDKHIGACPAGSAVAIQIWQGGHEAGLNGRKNAHSGDPTYTLGFVSGEMDRERMQESEKRPLTAEELFPDEAPEGRPSRPLVSITELSLALQERRDPPPIPTNAPETEHSYDVFGTWQKELAARERDIY